MKYLVHIRPDYQFTYAIDLWRRCVQEYVTKTSSNVPHCTLMTGRFKESDEAIIVQQLKSIQRKSFAGVIREFDVFEEDAKSTLVAKVSSPEVHVLHQDIIEQLHLYIDWSETPQQDVGDEKRKAAYEKYSSPFYAEFFNPHISIAEIKNDADKKKIIAALPKTVYGWFVSGFYLSKKKNDWVIVEKFELG